MANNPDSDNEHGTSFSRFVQSFSERVNDLAINVSDKITDAQKVLLVPLNVPMRAAMNAELKERPAAAALAREAHADRVPTKVSAYIGNAAAGGRVRTHETKTGEVKQDIKVRNTLQPKKMANVQSHELRHYKQVKELGMRFDQGYSLLHARTSVFNTLLVEADASTFEATSIAHKFLSGDKKTCDRLGDKSSGHEKVAEFIGITGKNKPQGVDLAGAIQDGSFARTIFAREIHDKDVYKCSHYHFIRNSFDNCKTLEDFQRTLKGDPGAKRITPTNYFKADYGQGFMAGMDMRALEIAVTRGQSAQERQLLHKTEQISRRILAGEVSASEYAQIRAQMMVLADRALNHAGGFILDTSPTAEKARKGLVQAAGAKFPPTTARVSAQRPEGGSFSAQAPKVTGMSMPTMSAPAMSAPAPRGQKR